MAVPHADGVTPTIDELVALRAQVGRRGAANAGRYGAAGPARSVLRGRGMEYAESREYSSGDDARHMDWRLTARTGRAHTKLFQTERERLTLVVGDTSPALYFGTRVRFKSVQAARAGALAAWAAVRDGDRIAALRGSTREPAVSPAPGSRGALHTIDALVRWYTQPPDDDAGLAVALEHAQRLLRPGSRLVLLADAASLRDVAAHRWPALAQHHECIVLLLTDPFDTAPPAHRLAFAHGGARTTLDLGADATRAAWRREFATPLDEALATLNVRGVRAQALSTDMPSDAWLPLLGARRVGAA
ncbi:DUF58 domain-containing protein [Cognatilysobacter bugurensis]|uniref:ATPase n=1 Tax=Cognatilysobacter bugurensis TaxID=543356 RepID=A0A918W878_9GAMM|nr:DUF58 domain-containing protein [Lysobacter bugurensis]GHA84681.1 ATPase [Lysobacter bugurensis]